MRKKKTGKKIAAVAGLVLVAALLAGVIYVNQYYHPAEPAQQAAEQMEKAGGDLVLHGDSGKGIIIYPGGKVDEAAYASMAQLLQQEGYTVIIASMPFRLSILSNYRAKDIVAEYDAVEEWYLIGHSLGGTSAGMCVEKYPELFAGAAFLGSYAYRDLSDYGGAVLVLDGSNDAILDRDNYEAAMDNYPEQTVFYVIAGGNHSGFGNYGQQSGDGEADITWDEQHQEVVRQISLLF